MISILRFLCYYLLQLLIASSLNATANASDIRRPYLSKGDTTVEAAPAHFYPHQLVDHLAKTEKDGNNSPYQGQQWSQRYYVSKDHFQGPGSPILVILGGEGRIEPSTGIMYPFVQNQLAQALGAIVLQPEHRFYGFSQPLVTARQANDAYNTENNDTNQLFNNGNSATGRSLFSRGRTEDANNTEDPRVRLFTSEQALMDAVRLIHHVATDQLQCDQSDKTSHRYCPVITVGGSYPGWLSAMARFRFPDAIDMAYAASAPMTFYSQQVDPWAYYNHITKVADETVSGCAAAVRAALVYVANDDNVAGGNNNVDFIPAMEVGVCPGTVPSYVVNRTIFLEELNMMVGYSFANDNMANYPPSNETRLYQGCQLFTSPELSAYEKIQQFLVQRLAGGQDKADDCFDMSRQLPTGKNPTISGGDWSGDGTGADAESWDFETCTLLVEKIGFSNESMFLPREWTLDWMTQHCQARFGVTPRPTELVDRWKFSDLLGQNASRIVLTNGLKDGWSVGAVKQNLSETLLVFNFPNGAHHSDLNHIGPSPEDTEDIRQGRAAVTNILSQWLKQMQATS